MEKFEDLNLRDEILRGIYAYGFENPSEIQKKSIPLILNGDDIIAQAQSGTGKTGSFTIGLLNRIDELKNSTQGIIILPTRELAEQVYEVITELSKYSKIRTLILIGGTNVRKNISDLQNDPHIIVGTPGRIIDMIEKRHLITEEVKTLVLDEADEILSIGFQETISSIFYRIPKETQICLFSATLPDTILELTKKFMNNPKNILIKKENLTLEGINQYYINCKYDYWKNDVILDLYENINIQQCIIYVNHKRNIINLYNYLKNSDFPIEYISGDRSVPERNEIMGKFRSGEIRILLSSDLLSRGIDIQQLSLVINYDLPLSNETYIHRIGRSGRYGRKGTAINLVTDNSIKKLQEIIEFYDTEIKEMPENIEI